MATEVMEHTRTTLTHLIESIDRFITDNRNSRDVGERWLCSELAPALALAREVRTRVGPENKVKVNEFRAREIEKELQGKRRETEVLERDLAALRKTA